MTDLPITKWYDGKFFIYAITPPSPPFAFFPEHTSSSHSGTFSHHYSSISNEKRTKAFILPAYGSLGRTCSVGNRVSSKFTEGIARYTSLVLQEARDLVSITSFGKKSDCLNRKCYPLSHSLPFFIYFLRGLAHVPRARCLVPQGSTCKCDRAQLLWAMAVVASSKNADDFSRGLHINLAKSVSTAKSDQYFFIVKT